MRAFLLVVAAALVPGCADPSRLFLHPVRDLVGTPADFGASFEEIRLERPGGATKAWWIPREGANAAVVVFGGNSGNRSHSLFHGRLVWEAGFSVLMMEYEGFGPDNGEVSIASLPLDAVAAVEWAARRADRVGVYGISLGSAVALGAAARRPELVDAICVEGTFRARPAMVQYIGFKTGRILAYPLALLARAFVFEPESDPQFTVNLRAPGCPVFFVHGDRDRLTRTEWAAQLFDLARGPKELWIMEDTGHAPEPRCSQDGEYAEQVGRYFRRTLLDEPQPQAGAGWSARPMPDGWHIEAGVVCNGPFPAPVEVVAVAGSEVARARVWVNAPETTVTLRTARRPDAVTARRYHRVTYGTNTWSQDLTPFARDYRRLRAIGNLPQAPVAELLALDVHPRLAAQYVAMLCVAAAEAPDADARRLLARAVAACPEKHEARFIVGDAIYWPTDAWTRDEVRARALDVFEKRGWDPAELESPR